MMLDYKSYFNEVYQEFIDKNGREPTLEECSNIREEFIELVEGICEAWESKYE